MQGKQKLGSCPSESLDIGFNHMMTWNQLFKICWKSSSKPCTKNQRNHVNNVFPKSRKYKEIETIKRNPTEILELLMHSKCWLGGEKNVNQEFYIQQKYSSKMKEKLTHSKINKSWECSLSVDLLYKKWERKSFSLKWKDTGQ